MDQTSPQVSGKRPRLETSESSSSGSDGSVKRPRIIAVMNPADGQTRHLEILDKAIGKFANVSTGQRQPVLQRQSLSSPQLTSTPPAGGSDGSVKRPRIITEMNPVNGQTRQRMVEMSDEEFEDYKNKIQRHSPQLTSTPPAGAGISQNSTSIAPKTDEPQQRNCAYAVFMQCKDPSGNQYIGKMTLESSKRLMEVYGQKISDSHSSSDQQRKFFQDFMNKDEFEEKIRPIIQELNLNQLPNRSPTQRNQPRSRSPSPIPSQMQSQSDEVSPDLLFHNYRNEASSRKGTTDESIGEQSHPSEESSGQNSLNSTGFTLSSTESSGVISDLLD